MMSDGNTRVARQMLKQTGRRAPVAEIARLVSEDVVVEIPGDTGALPWIGSRAGREAFAGFLREQRALLTSNWFKVDDILSNATGAVILGGLSATIKRTGRTAETSFAVVLTISGGPATRFQMLEDSYAAARAAR